METEEPILGTAIVTSLATLALATSLILAFRDAARREPELLCQQISRIVDINGDGRTSGDDNRHERVLVYEELRVPYDVSHPAPLSSLTIKQKRQYIDNHGGIDYSIF